MRFLYCALSVFALAGLSNAYNSGYNKIYGQQKIYAIPETFPVKEPPMKIFYVVEFPQISGHVSLMLVQKKDLNLVSSMTNCYNMNFTPQMNKTLSLANFDCQTSSHGTSHDQYIRCDGMMEIYQYSYEGYFFALSNCAKPWGLQNTSYDLTSREMPIVETASAASHFTSLSALFLVITLILFH